MSKAERWLWLGVLLMLLVAIAVVARDRGPSVEIEGGWVLDRVQTPSVDQTLHGPDDFRPELGIRADRALLAGGCIDFEYAVSSSGSDLSLTATKADRYYGPCSSRDRTPGRWDSWFARVDHASRHGSLLVLTGEDVRLVWHRAPPPPPPDPDGVSLDHGWRLTAGHVGGRRVSPVRLHPATVGLDPYGAAIDTGCNSAGAFWNSTGEGPIRFDFDPALTRTARRCSPAVMRQEHALLIGLQRARRAVPTTTSLALTGKNSRLVFRRVGQPDYKDLRNTRWVLAARAFGSVTVPARRLRPISPRTDLRLTVGVGDIAIESPCRTLRSGFATDGLGAITGYHQHAECESPTALDRYLTDLYSHSWRFRVDGDTLYIQGYSGRGLIYRRLRS